MTLEEICQLIEQIRLKLIELDKRLAEFKEALERH